MLIHLMFDSKIYVSEWGYFQTDHPHYIKEDGAKMVYLRNKWNWNFDAAGRINDDLYAS